MMTIYARMPFARPRNTNKPNANTRKITKYANYLNTTSNISKYHRKDRKVVVTMRNKSFVKLAAEKLNDDNTSSPVVYTHVSPVAQLIVYDLNTAIHINS
jgi:hypothetical protein